MLNEKLAALHELQRENEILLEKIAEFDDGGNSALATLGKLGLGLGALGAGTALGTGAAGIYHGGNALRRLGRKALAARAAAGDTAASLSRGLKNELAAGISTFRDTLKKKKVLSQFGDVPLSALKRRVTDRLYYNESPYFHLARMLSGYGNLAESLL